MSFYLNSGYFLKINENVSPDGVILNCSGMPYAQLYRKKFNKKYPHTKNRLFDPQYYMEQLDPHESPKPCYKLVTYPWFGAQDLPEFDSGIYSLQSYDQEQRAKIVEIWQNRLPETEEQIQFAVASAIEFQIQIGCEGIILPSPLTDETATDYSRELMWLDYGIKYIKENDIKLPIYATIAISDICFKYTKVENNPLINLILDVISSRKVDGVYIIVDQRLENDRARYIGNSNTISAILELVHGFSQENHLKTIVNYFGPFGMVFASVGAHIWSSDWYKSLVRFRLSDQIGVGRTYPLYWSSKIACDINLDSDLDTINKKGLLSLVLDETSASKGLIEGLKSGLVVNSIPSWYYRIGNKTASMEHYRLSIIQANVQLSSLGNKDQLLYIQQWLDTACESISRIKAVLGEDSATKMNHVSAWRDAFIDYRRVHSI